MTTSITLPMLDLPEGGLERQLGSLLLKKGGQNIALPLQGVDVQAKVVDRVAEVTIKQVFRNSLTEHLEAVYIFPMAAGSAVSSFNMMVGDRKIKGVVQERAEARRAYATAITEGKRAALLEQERDDVFTVQVGNLPPGEEVTIEITYSERLPFFEDGKTELRLPLVVAPRYIPGKELERNQVGDGIENDTDLVPDASRISPPRLAKGVDPQTALKMSVEILFGDGEISDLACSQHATKTGLSNDGVVISLAKANERLNRDFVLRWTSSGSSVKSSLSTFTGTDGETYGILSIMPPKRSGFLGAPRDVIFVLDRSGSMQGIKMTSAVRACAVLLNTLGPTDRFAIAAFDNSVDWMPGVKGTRFTNADQAGIEKGENFLREINARGGTELNHCLQEAFSALRGRHDIDGRMPSLVVLTDGEVGNEAQILQSIQTGIGDARLFSVGIDTAVNSGLLNRLAKLGGGTASYVEPGVQLEEALASVAREIGAPLVTELKIESQDLTIDKDSITPNRIPDIFQGRASLTFLKLTGKGKLTIRGKYSDGKPFEEKVKAHRVEVPAIAQLWAKAHIVELEDQYRISNDKARIKTQIINLAVKHSLLTKFTAFVVVDEAEIVNKTGDLHKVVQPAEMPDAWEMGADFGAVNGSLQKLRQAHATTGEFKKLQSFGAAAMYDAAPTASPAPSARMKSMRKMEVDEQLEPGGIKFCQSAPSKDLADAGSGGSSGWGDANDAWGAPSAGKWEAAADGWSNAPAQPVADSAEAAPCWGAPAAQAGGGGNADGWGDPSSPPPAPGQSLGSIGSKSNNNAKELSSTPNDADASTGSLAELIRDQVSKSKVNPPEEEVELSALQAPSRQEAAKASPAPQAGQSPAPTPVPPTEAAPAAKTDQVAGSYGSAVRDQVKEVIVRQAMQGADWKQICDGPMQVNNISPEEVEQEVDRRQNRSSKSRSFEKPAGSSSLAGGIANIFKKLEELGHAITGGAPTPPEPPARSGQNSNAIQAKFGHELARLRPALEEFFKEFENAFAKVEHGEELKPEQLESMRVRLVQFLAPTQFGMECPELQKFLRSTAIELIGSLKDKSVTQDELTQFWNSKRSLFESVKAELEGALSGKEPSFWDASV